MGLGVLGLPTFLVSIDFSVLYLAVPHLSAALAPSGIQQLWIVDIYGLLVAGFLVTMGTIGDRIGRKKLLLIGGASVAAAFSNSPQMLTASRALLGVAGAAVMPWVAGPGHWIRVPSMMGSLPSWSSQAARCVSRGWSRVLGRGPCSIVAQPAIV